MKTAQILMFSVLALGPFIASAETKPPKLAAPWSMVNFTFDASTAIPPESGKDLNPLLCNGNIEYLPVPPIAVSTYDELVMKGGEPVTVQKAFTTGNIAEINKELPNVATDIYFGEEKIEGSVGAFGAKLKRQTIIMDFMKYRSEEVRNKEGKRLFYARIGAGMRLTIRVSMAESNFGGNLLALAASAKAGKTVGSISAEVVGMDSNDITNALPFTADLTEASVQRIIEALAIIKSKYHSSETTILPQLLAKLVCKTEAITPTQ